MGDFIRLKVKRQDGPSRKPYWEIFKIDFHPSMNVISCLQELQKHPITEDGKTVSPIVWEANCLEEVCGACTMVVNGRVRQSCTAIIEKPNVTITLEPMRKFPVIRDLWVDRQRLFDTLQKTQAWATVDGTYDLGLPPLQADEVQQLEYKLSTCMTCGCCVDACPQFTFMPAFEDYKEGFVGAFAVGQVLRFNLHPIGKFDATKRLDAMMGTGGIGECANAQVCVEVCPKKIPLLDAIALVERQITKRMFTKLLGKGR